MLDPQRPVNRSTAERTPARYNLWVTDSPLELALRPALFAALLLTSTGIALAQPGTGVLRVAPTGSNAGSCGSIAAPCAHPQRAVNLAVSGDEIRVAAGTYVYDPALDTVCTANLGNTAVVCIVNKELEVRGGFSTADWTNPAPDANPTVLDGLNARRGVLVVRTSAGAPVASLELSGFTVYRGRAVPPTLGAGNALLFAFGGGLDSVLARTVIRSVEFVSNRSVGANSGGQYGGSGSGGGVALRASPAGTLLEDVRFADNVAQGGTGTERGGYALGGGLFVFDSELTANRILLERNEARAGNSTGDGTDSTGQSADGLGGGAAFELGTTATLTDWRAWDNLAVGGDAGNVANALAGDGYGGAVFAEGRSGADGVTLTVSRLYARNNEARGGSGTARSGGIGGGGAWSSLDTNLVLSRFQMIDNLAAGGSGTSEFRGQAAGGALHLSRFFTSSSLDIENGVVAGNAAVEGAAGNPLPSGGGGGGLWLQGMGGTLDHLTIDGNSTAPSHLMGQAMMINAGAGTSDVTLSFSAISNHDSSSATATHVISGNTLRIGGVGLYAGNSDDSNEGQGGSGTFVDHDDMGVVSDLFYVSPGAPAYDYHLTPDSPAISAGNASAETEDYEGQTRDGSQDVGADELGRPAQIFSDAFESGRIWSWSDSTRL